MVPTNAWLSNPQTMVDEVRFRNLVENINDTLFSTDENGVVTYISPSIEEFTGYTPLEIIGNSFVDHIFEEDRERIVESFKKLKTSKIQAQEYRIITKSEKSAWVRSSSKPIFTGGEFKG